MRANVMILGLALFAPCVALADLDILWERTVGGPAADGFRSVTATQDGGCVAVGYTYSFGAGDVDLYLVRFDAMGDTLWTRAFGGARPDYGHGVCETDDGALIAVGYTMSTGAGREDVFIVKTSAQGQPLWSRTYGGTALDEALAICPSRDGHFVVAGQTESRGAGLSDVYLLKIDADGDTLWTRTFGGEKSDWAVSVCETSDAGYVASGTTGSFNATRDAYVVKTAPDGTLLWERRVGITQNYREDYGTGICELPDGHLAGTGWRSDQDHGDPCQVGYLFMDSGGVPSIYAKYYDPYIEYGSSLCTTVDGGQLICGAAKDPLTHKNDLLLLKRGADGSWEWFETMGGAGSDWGCSIIHTGADHYIIAGCTESTGNGRFDGWLLKVKAYEAAAPEAGEKTETILEAPRPSVFGASTTLRFNLEESTIIELAIYAVNGRRMALLAEGLYPSGTHAIDWDGAGDSGARLSPGIYWANLRTGGARTSRRMVCLE